jgi:hypothetical protein
LRSVLDRWETAYRKRDLLSGDTNPLGVAASRLLQSINY